VFLVVVVVAVCGCTRSAPTGSSNPTAIRLASYDFTENQILAEVYAEGVRRAGLPVVVQHGIGPREVVQPALQQGVVDVVIEYLGTAFAFVRPGTTTAQRPELLRDGLASALDGRGVTVLDAARAQDQNGFAVTTSFAAEHRISRLSDLADLAPKLTFGGPPECPQRRFCLRGLESAYGLHFGQVRSMTSRTATVEALVSGEIDVGLLETTDARLAVAPVMLLLDDRALQPPENIVPLVRTAVLDRAGPKLRRALDAVSARLTTDTLVRLNRSVEVDGLTPAEAARRWWADV
jgi:osmoprotectant transport system substrate-binding protein